MKKGFTLIELLAVIVILAIIALIATPIILNIIGNAKNESNERTKELYLDAVKDAIARKNLTEEFNPNECTVQKDGNLKCEGKNLQVEVSGTKPCSGTITFDKKGKIINETVKYCNEGKDNEIVYSTLNKNGWILSENGIGTIEFLPNGRLPEGMSKEEFLALEPASYFDLSDDGKIHAYISGEKYCIYYDDEYGECTDEGYRNGKIYIYSENGIRLPEDCSYLMDMFSDIYVVIFNDVDTSKVKNMSHMFDTDYVRITLDISEFDTSNVTDMSYMFGNVNGTIDLSSFDTSKVTNMSHMFYFNDNGSGYIEKIIFGENFDTSNVTDMSYMFSDQMDLEELDLSAFNTSSVQNMSHMFGMEDLGDDDYNLKKIIFGKDFNTSNVTDMSYMFSGRAGLTTLDLSNFDTSSVEDMSYMFSYCYGLKELDLSSFDTRQVSKSTSMLHRAGYDTDHTTIYISDKWTLPDSLLDETCHYELKN